MIQVWGWNVDGTPEGEKIGARYLFADDILKWSKEAIDDNGEFSSKLFEDSSDFELTEQFTVDNDGTGDFVTINEAWDKAVCLSPEEIISWAQNVIDRERKSAVIEIPLEEKIVCGEHTFEVIDYIPHGYEFWNIGKNMTEGYLPLCKLCAYQPFPEGRSIDINSLKAIKLDGAQTVLSASILGPTTIEAMEAYVERYKNKSLKPADFQKLKRVEAALDVLKDVKRYPNFSNKTVEQENALEQKITTPSLSERIQSASTRVQAGSNSKVKSKAIEPEI